MYVMHNPLISALYCTLLNTLHIGFCIKAQKRTIKPILSHRWQVWRVAQPLSKGTTGNRLHFIYRFWNDLWLSAFDKDIKSLQMLKSNRAYSVPAYGALDWLFVVPHIETDMVFELWLEVMLYHLSLFTLPNRFSTIPSNRVTWLLFVIKAI